MNKNIYTTSTSYTGTFSGNTATNKSIYIDKTTVCDTSAVPEDVALKIKPEETSTWSDEGEALNLPDCCKNCPNRPSKQNGYTSICLCATPALTSPIVVW